MNVAKEIIPAIISYTFRRNKNESDIVVEEKDSQKVF